MGITQERFRNTILTCLVILSFFLSYKLWTAGRNIGEESTSGQTTRITGSSVNHNRSDVFRPVEVVIHEEARAETVLTSHTYPLRNLWHQTFNDRMFDQLIRSEMKGFNQYIDDIQSGDWLEFIYLEEVPLGIIEQHFDEMSREAANTFYNRMLFNIDDPHHVYFYNTKTEIYHVASVLEDQNLNMDAFLNQDNLPYVEAKPYIVEDNIIYITTNPVEIPYKSYIIDQLPNTVYINSFFPDTSLVDVRSNGNITRYIDLTKEVSINENTETLNYLRQISDSGAVDPTTRYLRSFDQINRFENWVDTFVLSKYNRVDQMISFRRELDGIQVFSTFDFESVTEIAIVESGVTRLKLPIRSIRTPIAIPETDEDDDYRTLTAGTTLMDDIQNNVPIETYNKIEDVTIGYTWMESEENSQVVNFTPEWYILINGTWITYNNLLSLQEDELYGF